MATENTPRRMPWFRLYDDLLTNLKTVQLSNAETGVWIKLLCLANQQNPRGEIYYGLTEMCTFVAKALHLRKNMLQKCFVKFEDLGLIHFNEENKCLVITNWDKRQFASDDVTARTLPHMRRKRLRERSREHPRAEADTYKDKSIDQTGKNDDHVETWSRINQLSKELKKTFPEVNAFVARANKAKRHPTSILQALERIFEGNAKDPRALFTHIVDVESPNFHANDYVKEATKMKGDTEEVRRDGYAK
jgi:hypothetical protein